jgi:hypothetical protein
MIEVMSEMNQSSALIENAVQVACRAPSLHNSQPWHWVIDNASVELFLDAHRVLPATDRAGREALISCGAVLDHFRVAMAAAGWQVDVERYPEPDDRLHLATIGFTPMASVTDRQRSRANAIMLRRTDRLPFVEPFDWPQMEGRLRDAVASDAVRMDVIADEWRPELRGASDLHESLRLFDTNYHTELDYWTAPFGMDAGIPHSALLTAGEGDRVDIGRTFPLTRHNGRRREIPRDRAKVVVLSTYDEDRLSVLRCGEKLSALLLEATMAGLATCTITHMTELQASREIVMSLVERGATPQALIRVGVAPMIEACPPATPRRPMTEVLEVR